MIETATGLILRTRPLTETSLIVHWLTPELGRIATVAKGARRAQSPFRGKLDLLYELDFSFNRSRRSDLHTLCEVSLRETNAALRRDYTSLQQAAYCIALVEQSTETETPLSGVYELMHGFIQQLSRQPPQPQLVFGFELKLLQELGLHPDLEKSRLSQESRELVETFVAGDWRLIARSALTAGQLTELRRFLHGFLIFHLGKIPAGREEALKMELPAR